MFLLGARVVSFGPPRNEVLLNKTSESMAVTAAPLRLPQAALHFIAFLQDAESKQPRRRLRALTLYYGNNARGRRMLVSKVTRVATMQKKKKKGGGRREEMSDFYAAPSGSRCFPPPLAPLWLFNSWKKEKRKTLLLKCVRLDVF